MNRLEAYLAKPEYNTPHSLLSTRKGFDEEKAYLQKLNAFVVGGKAIDKYKEDFISPRYQEEYGKYQRRLKLATYSPVMSGAINEVVNKFSTGNYVLHLPQDTIDEVKQVTYSTEESLKGKRYLTETLSLLLKFQKVYAVIEGFEVQGKIVTKEQQNKALSNYTPTISTYLASNVAMEGEDWIKLISNKTYTDLTGDTYLRWSVRFIDSENYYTYTFETNEERTKWRPIGGLEWVGGINHQIQVTDVVTPEITPNLIGTYPVFKIELPEEKDLASKLLPLQIAYSGVQNSCFEAARDAGAHQKWITPLDENGKVDLGKDKPKTGNDTLLKVNKYEVTEIAGTCIGRQQSLMSDIESQIKHIAGLSGLSFNHKPTVQSGVAKQMENNNLEANLYNYGMLLLDFYSSILSYINKIKGYDVDFTLSGFDDFSLDTLGDCIDQLIKLNTLEEYRLPDEIVKGQKLKVAKLLNPNISKEDLMQFETLLEGLPKDGIQPDD